VRNTKFIRLTIATLLLLPMAWTGVAFTQQVSGIVQVNNTAMPSNKTSVALIDSTGAIAAITITSSDGGFTLRAPGAGTYRIRARRIGFLPDSSKSLILSAGQRLPQIRLSLNTFPVQLVRVGIEEARRCVIAPQAGATVFRLWQEAQSALTATAATSQDVRVGFVLHRFERKLDARTGQIEESRSWDSRATTSEPYASVPAESLAAHGFVVPDGKMLVYYAPDARTLISDAFARTHCFHPIENGSHPGLIGLSFAPTEQRLHDRSVRDVSGTLWFDRVTLNLRTLDFEYGGNTGNASYDSPAATGQLEYMRLPSEAWVVSNWVIRMPVVTLTTAVTAPNGLAADPGGITISRRRMRQVTSVWEAGGDVENTQPLRSLRDSSAIVSAYGVVLGSVVDTTASGLREGVRGVRVTLHPGRMPSDSPASYSAYTDSAGSFAINGVAPATYSIEMESARLDTLGIEIVKRTVRVEPATQQSFVTTIPTAANAAYNMCQNSLRPREVLLHGLVLDEASRPMPHARVDVSWFAIADSRREHFEATTRNIATFSDEHGAYVICGIPADQRLKIVVKDDATARTMTTFSTQTTLVGMMNFVLHSTVNTNGCCTN
jgi:carboxypeptidase family protein